MTQKVFLIIEDEFLIGLNLKMELEKRGYSVLGIESSGPAVLKRLETSTPDVLLVDINLKGNMNGIELCLAIKKMGMSPIIIYITGYLNDEIVQEARKVDPQAILEKPLEIDELLNVLASCKTK